MCKNPGDSNYFQVLREEGDGEEKRSAEKKGVARDGEKKRKKGGRGLHILLLRKCESVLISHRCGAANSDARPHATASTEEAAAGKRHKKGRTR